MSIEPSIDPSAWKKIGQSRNATFYELDAQVLVVVPVDGSRDTFETATDSVRIQLEHLRPLSRRAGIVVMMDNVAEQDSKARGVYRDAPDPAYQVCYALVGGTPFGRAVASIFIGLSPPKVPTKMFGTFEEAVGWARGMVAKS